MDAATVEPPGRAAMSLGKLWLAVILFWMVVNVALALETVWSDVIVRDVQREVVLPRQLFSCLRWEFDSPEGLIRIPTQAKRWAVELSERGETEVVCLGQTWVVRVE